MKFPFRVNMFFLAPFLVYLLTVTFGYNGSFVLCRVNIISLFVIHLPVGNLWLVIITVLVNPV